MVNDTRAEYDHLQTLSDEALCALVKQGSRDAEEILVGRYHRLVRSCARPYFLAGGDSEDLCRRECSGLSRQYGSTSQDMRPLCALLPRPAFVGGCILCCVLPPPGSIHL